jgi:hypothetical protein
MAEAYMLPGELRDCGCDCGAAFARYEQRLMPFLKRKQLSAAKSDSSIAPKTAFGIRFRNLVVRLMRRLSFVVDSSSAANSGIRSSYRTMGSDGSLMAMGKSKVANAALQAGKGAAHLLASVQSTEARKNQA